jgi:DNA-binding SARP family transcriptional activator/tetratricopeptide (TPR) repeat protein
MSHLSLGFLGEPRLLHNGQPLHFPTRKTLALLAYLAVEVGPVSRETLAALLWPESNGLTARAALRNTLSYLRAALDDGTGPHLLIERERLAFDVASDAWVDVWALETAAETQDHDAEGEHLQVALAIYRGDFLAGFSLPDAAPFDDWVTLQRERYHELAVRLLERLATIQEARGDQAAARATLRRWIDLAPLHEPAYHRLMRLQFVADERDAVRHTYERCRARLHEDLGIEPSPATAALAAAARKPLVQDLVGPRQPASSGPLILPFVGREAAYLRLMEGFFEARRDGMRVLLIEGEAGIGKTRLATEFLGWAAEQGADTVRGRAFESGAGLSYQPLTEAWRSRLERANAPDDLLDDVWLTELSRLLPDLRVRYPDLPPPADDPGAPGRLYEAVVQLGLALAARAPLVLFLDDLQWADQATLDLLRHAIQRWREQAAPILPLLTVRQEALAAWGALAGWYSTLERLVPLVRLPLGRLSPVETATLSARIVSTDSADERARLATWLFAESQGVPFFLAETLAFLIEQGWATPSDPDDGTLRIVAPIGPQPGTTRALLPPGVRDVIRARLGQLSPHGFVLLVAAAVLGPQATFDALCEIAALEEGEALEALDNLLVRGLLVTEEEASRPLATPRYRCAHDKVRDVTYTEAGAARRQVFHRRALAALERARPPAAELAHHAHAARLAEEAFRYSLAAAQEAMGLFAVRDAIAHYEQARALLAPSGGSQEPSERAAFPPLHLQLGRAYELVNHWELAQATYSRLLEWARAQGDGPLQVVVLNRLATLAVHSAFDLDLSRSLLEEALHLAQAPDDGVGLAETSWNLAQLGVYTWNPNETLVRGQEALALAERLGHEELAARCHNVLALGYYDRGQFFRMAHHASEAARRFAALGDRAMEADSLGLQGNALVMSGRAAEGVRAGREALAIMEAVGSPWGEVTARLHLAQGLQELGQLEEALAVAERGSILAHEHQLLPLTPYSLSTKGAVERALGWPEVARSSHVRALQADEAIPSRPFAEMVHSELCADCVLLGDWPAALAHARQAVAYHRAGTLSMALIRWYEVEALLRGGEATLAHEEANHFGTLIASPEHGADNPRLQLAWHQMQAILAGEAARDMDAIRHLQAAAEVALALGLPIELAAVETRLARLLERSGKAGAPKEAGRP